MRVETGTSNARQKFSSLRPASFAHLRHRLIASFPYMTSLIDLLTCIAPYGCAILFALGGYLISPDGSIRTLVMATMAGLVGALAMAFAVSSAAHGPMILGACSPLTLGACIFGAIVGSGLSYFMSACSSSDQPRDSGKRW
jgi:hypothetical protein